MVQGEPGTTCTSHSQGLSAENQAVDGAKYRVQSVGRGKEGTNKCLCGMPVWQACVAHKGSKAKNDKENEMSLCSSGLCGPACVACLCGKSLCGTQGINVRNDKENEYELV